MGYPVKPTLVLTKKLYISNNNADEGNINLLFN